MGFTQRDGSESRVVEQQIGYRTAVEILAARREECDDQAGTIMTNLYPGEYIAAETAAGSAIIVKIA